MSSHESSNDQNNPQTKKRRRGESRASRQTPRYQCYCDKIYLSYPALYLHLKNKHPQCFLNNRKIQVTKFKESITHNGFKILRMEKDPNELKSESYMPDHMYKAKNMPPYPFPNYHQFAYSAPQNFMMPPMDSKPYYMDNPMNSMSMPKNLPLPMPQTMPAFNPISQSASKSISQLKPQSEGQKKVSQVPKDDVISLINNYIEEKVSQEQLERRQVTEIELLYSLLPKLIKQKDEMIRVWYNMTANPGESINSTDLKYLEGVLGHFREVYTKQFVEKHRNGNQSALSKQEKLMRGMVRVNRYFCDLELMNKELRRFEKWLIKREVIERVNDNFPL